MADSIYTFDPTAGNNTALDGIAYGPNQLYHQNIDNLFRAFAAKHAQFVDDIGGVATTAGTANAQTVTLASGFTAYAAGQIFRVKIGSGLTNTSSTVTLNVNSIGTKTVKVNYGGVLADPLPGDLQAGAYADFTYDGTYLVLMNAQQRAPYPSGHLYGLTLSNNGSDATNDIDIAVGTARSSDDSANIDLTSALTKRGDASWAVGTGNGGMDTGSIADGLNYVWLIKRPDTGVVDALISASASAPTMPSNYTLKRLRGVFYRLSGVNQVPRHYDANGNEIGWEPISSHTLSAAPSWDKTGLSAYRRLRITGTIRPATNNVGIYLRLSTDNGSNYDAGTTSYDALFRYNTSTATTPTGALNTSLPGFALFNVSVSSSAWTTFNVLIEEFNKAQRCLVTASVQNVDGAGSSVWHNLSYVGAGVGTTARNALRIIASSGNISGDVTIEGVRG